MNVNRGINIRIFGIPAILVDTSMYSKQHVLGTFRTILDII